MLKRIWEKIKKLWENANILQKIGLGVIVFVLIATRIIKWALIFKVCCKGLLWAWNTLI